MALPHLRHSNGEFPIKWLVHPIHFVVDTLYLTTAWTGDQRSDPADAIDVIGILFSVHLAEASRGVE